MPIRKLTRVGLEYNEPKLDGAMNEARVILRADIRGNRFLAYTE